VTAKLASSGIEALLPSGFEGTIFQRNPVGGADTHTVAQFATFPLPVDVGDFGGGATTLMGPEDVFAVLFEYGQESIGRPLFARLGMPSHLAPRDFRPYVLRRGLSGQAGTQWFFTEQGRPFTLYVVIGAYARRVALTRRVNELLSGLMIYANPGAGAA